MSNVNAAEYVPSFALKAKVAAKPATPAAGASSSTAPSTQQQHQQPSYNPSNNHQHHYHPSSYNKPVATAAGAGGTAATGAGGGGGGLGSYYYNHANQHYGSNNNNNHHNNHNKSNLGRHHPNNSNAAPPYQFNPQGRAAGAAAGGGSHHYNPNQNLGAPAAAGPAGSQPYHPTATHSNTNSTNPNASSNAAGGISVTHTGNNSAQTHTPVQQQQQRPSPSQTLPTYAPPPAMPPPSPFSRAAAGTAGAATAGGVPTRLSPYIPFRTPTRMNPNAKEFVPFAAAAGSGGAGAAAANSGAAAAAPAALPSTTEEEAAAAAAAAAGGGGRAGAGAAAAAAGSGSGAPVATGPTSAEARRLLASGANIFFNVNAGVYKPTRTMARLRIVAPSPVVAPCDLTPEERERMPLKEVWGLFYQPTCGADIKAETYNPAAIFRIDSIASFWSVFNNISPPSVMPESTLYLFRDGISPKWEDAANVNGGILRIPVAGGASQVDAAWERLLCQTVGEGWSTGAVRRAINGVAVKIRGNRGFVLELWLAGGSNTNTTNAAAPGAHKRGDISNTNSPSLRGMSSPSLAPNNNNSNNSAGGPPAELKADLAQLLHPVLGEAFSMTYWSHAQMRERAQAAEQNRNKTLAAAAAAHQQQQGKKAGGGGVVGGHHGAGAAPHFNYSQGPTLGSAKPAGPAVPSGPGDFFKRV